MKRRENPFLVFLDHHPEAGAEELRRLFRELAKRTHPDTGRGDDAAFVEIQRLYHVAIAAIADRSPVESGRGSLRATAGDGSEGRPGVWIPPGPRERVLHLLYRYKAHLPSIELSSRPLPRACLQAFDAATIAAAEYGAQHVQTMERFGAQFHRNRREVSRYPDVLTKYLCFLRGLSSFFDFMLTPNEFNNRLARSYFDEIHPVTDYDPATSPALRSNRSAPARAALFRFRTWLIEEMEQGPCRIV